MLVTPKYFFYPHREIICQSLFLNHVQQNLLSPEVSIFIYHIVDGAAVRTAK